jgi:putative glutamine amidotransferase
MNTMHLKLFILSLSIIISSCTGRVEQTTPAIDDNHYIVLMHPTVHNLKTFQFLTENGVFPLPSQMKVLGVYSTSGSYNYQLSHDYLQQENIRNITLLGLEALADPGQIFSENALSKEFRKLFQTSEGMIFFGGPDVPPAVYGEPTHLLTSITDPHRHYLELSMLFHLLGGYQDENVIPLLEENPQYRILGICLGMQSMNIATGGTMVQDIPMELYGLATVEQVFSQPQHRQHRNYFTNMNLDNQVGPASFHPVVLSPGSTMATIAGSADYQPVILSSHHQALKKIGKGWRITATCLDGTIAEAIEHEKYPNVIGVQFHPEVPALYKDEPQRLVPGETTGKSYRQTYPAYQGETFHENFWKYIGAMYNN